MSRKDLPRISVVIPTWNRAHCIAACLDSVTSQTRPADEVIVVDDGSTDDTATALAPYAQRGVIVIHQDNAGVSAARNAGIARASGDWVTFLDSDDLWTPDRLAILHRDLAAEPEGAGVHHANAHIVGPGYEQEFFALRGWNFPKAQATIVADALPYAISGIFSQATGVRRDWIAEAGGFDTEMKIHEDTDLFCRLALQGPWMIAGDVVAEVRRVGDDEAALTNQAHTRRLYVHRMHARYLEALLAEDLTPAQRRLVRRCCSNVLLELAQSEAEEDPASARGTLINSALHHPSPLKGWLKSLPPLFLGERGFQMVMRKSDFLRSRSGRS